MADVADSSAAFTELKDSSNGKGDAHSIPINPLASSSKPLPTTVPKPTAAGKGLSAGVGYSTLFQYSTAERFSGDWFVSYLRQTRVLIFLALLVFLLTLIIWAAALGKAPAPGTRGAYGGACSNAWRLSEVVPDVISVCPPAEATIFHASPAIVDMGALIPAADVASAPVGIFVPQPVNSAYYTAVFLDPDTPSLRDPTSRSYLHGIITNLRLAADAKLRGLEWLVPYEAPEPSVGTGAHRYVWLIYRHSSAVGGLTPPNRNRFNVESWFRSTWTQQPQLVAANYFHASTIG